MSAKTLSNQAKIEKKSRVFLNFQQLAQKENDFLG